MIDLLNSKFTIVLFLIVLMLTGCNGNSNENLKTILQEKESTLTAQDKVKELLIMTEGNYDQLACILNASPSSLKRLNEGETFATPKAEVEINRYYNYFLVESESIENYKADCISYAWYHHVKIFMSNWWFWVGVIILIIIAFVINESEGDGELGCMPFVLLFFPALYLIVYLFSYFGGTPDYSSVQDNFKNTIDTYWESQI